MRLVYLYPLLLAGCMVPNAREKLSESLQKYNAAVRWGAKEWAAEHVAPEKRKDLFAQRVEFGELQVTDCQVGAVKLKGKGKAVALVQVDWYLVSTLTVRTSIIEQQWDLRSGRWLMTSERLVKGAPYPPLMSAPKARRFQHQPRRVSQN